MEFCKNLFIFTQGIYQHKNYLQFPLKQINGKTVVNLIASYIYLNLNETSYFSSILALK